MKQINCIVVDDEPLAREVIETYIEKTPFLSLSASFESAWQLKSYLKEKTADLIFLDMEMPDLNGLTFLKSFQQNLNVIFVTAYRDYAVEAFEVNAIDYLLKPLAYDRFLNAVDKLEKSNTVSEPAKEQQHLFISVDRKMVKIAFDSIEYIEAQGDYVKFFLTGEKPILSKKTIKELLTELPSALFVQIHRSFVINKQKINAYTQESVQVGEKWLSISRSYKKDLNFS